MSQMMFLGVFLLLLRAVEDDSWRWGAFVVGCAAGALLACYDAIRRWRERRKEQLADGQPRDDDSAGYLREGRLPVRPAARAALAAHVAAGLERSHEPSWSTVGLIAGSVGIPGYAFFAGGTVRTEGSLVAAACCLHTLLAYQNRRKRLAKMRRILARAPRFPGDDLQ